MACVYCSNLPFNYPKRVATIANIDGQLALQTQTPTPKLSSPQRSTRERGRRRRLIVDESHQEIELFSASREFRLVWCVCHSALLYHTHTEKMDAKKNCRLRKKKVFLLFFPPDSCLVEGLLQKSWVVRYLKTQAHTHTVEINLKRYCINNGWWDNSMGGRKQYRMPLIFFCEGRQRLSWVIFF